MYSREQLIDALVAEWEFLIHDDFDPALDPTPEEYRESISDLTYDELVEETQTDDIFPLKHFMDAYGIAPNIHTQTT